MQRAVILLALLAVAAVTAQPDAPYFTGDGGKDVRLAVLEPVGKGLSEDDKLIPSRVQSSMTGYFNKFSAMTIIDRQNLEKILGELQDTMSVFYSDSDRVEIGNFTNANHILTGAVDKTTNGFIIEFYITEIQSGVRKASYPPKRVSLLALDNFSAVREATADLLAQMGVNLTNAGRGELKQTENAAKIRAEDLLARGMRAQKQGTEIEAWNYFSQAAFIDTSLAEAVKRASVMAASISSGNIGENVRNAIARRKEQITQLENVERLFDNFNRTGYIPYTLSYTDTTIQEDKINYNDETVTLSIKTSLYGGASVRAWSASMDGMLQMTYDRLEATNKKNEWELHNWPRQLVTGLNPFPNTKRSRTFNIVVELVNSREVVIGRSEFQTGYYWEYYYDGSGRLRIYFAPESIGKKEVKFRNVKANDITDKFTIRIATINKEAAETAVKKGVLLSTQVMSEGEFARSCLEDAEDAHYNNGNASMNKGEYYKAIAEYSEVIRGNMNVSPAEVYYKRGLAYMNSKFYESAINDFLAVLQINPDNSNARNALERAKGGAAAEEAARREAAEKEAAIAASQAEAIREAAEREAAELEARQAETIAQRKAAASAEKAAQKAARRAARKENNKLSAGAGGFFDGDFGGGIEWNNGGAAMPYYGGGAYIFFDAVYAEVSAGYSSGGGKWESGAAQPDKLPDMQRSSLNIGVSLKYPIGAGLVKFFPLAGIGYEAVISGKLEYSDGTETRKLDGAGLLPKAGTLSALWYRFGGGVDIAMGGSVYFRAEALYGLRTEREFEKYCAELYKARTTNTDAQTRPGGGLTFNAGIGVKF